MRRGTYGCKGTTSHGSIARRMDIDMYRHAPAEEALGLGHVPAPALPLLRVLLYLMLVDVLLGREGARKHICKPQPPPQVTYHGLGALDRVGLDLLLALRPALALLQPARAPAAALPVETRRSSHK